MKVLVAYDGSPHASAAINNLQQAGLPPDSEILVVSIANRGWPPASHPKESEGQFDSPWNATMKEAEAFAESAAEQIRKLAAGWKVISEPLWGDPAKVLLKTIDHWKPDLLVVGSHGRSAAGRLLLGSVSLELVHHAPCSVRVTRLSEENGTDTRRIIVATDGSEHAESTIQSVAARRWPAGTEVRVISVFDALVPTVGRFAPPLEANTFATEPAFKVIEEADHVQRARLQTATATCVERLKSAGLNTTGHLVEGDPRTQILEQARLWHAATVFVGARGLGALDRLLLGSVSSAVVTHAHCTVEVVRPK